MVIPLKMIIFLSRCISPSQTNAGKLQRITKLSMHRGSNDHAASAEDLHPQWDPFGRNVIMGHKPPLKLLFFMKNPLTFRNPHEENHLLGGYSISKLHHRPSTKRTELQLSLDLFCDRLFAKKINVLAREVINLCHDCCEK